MYQPYIDKIEELLPGYLSGELTDEEKALVSKWLDESPENLERLAHFRRAWEAISDLRQMEQFNSFDALRKIENRLHRNTAEQILYQTRKIAAILLLPLMVYAGWLTYRNFSNTIRKEVTMQTVTSREGMVSQLSLSDGTKVWLNSNSSIEFPLFFTGNNRDVKITGEAFLEVAHDPKKPFKVHAGQLNINVIGTSFNVACFPDEPQTEVVLINGKVNLSKTSGNHTKDYGNITPGTRAIYHNENEKIVLAKVDTDKYLAWRDGTLIFRDDHMEEVIKRLSRWFNVQFIIADPEIKGYTYKATFRNENLRQVMQLLALSAPIEYEIIESKQTLNVGFSKTKVIMKKKRD